MPTSKEQLLKQLTGVIRKLREGRLWRTASKAVPGEGNPHAKVVFIGEAPGYEEDKVGRPFVGRAGKLLDQLLSKNGIGREEVYITNVVKHRPPGNRAPNKDEIRIYLPFLLRELQIISPKLIVTLGRYALEVFVKDRSVTKLHGVPLKAGARLILPMYHPAAALRSRGVLLEMEKDFRKIKPLLSGRLEATEELGSKQKDKNQLRLF